MRRAVQRDANQAEIVQALEQAGYSVEDLAPVGGGVPDLLVGGIDRRTGLPATWIMEVKTRSGRLNKRQKAWHAAWRGPIVTVRTPAEALAAVGATQSTEESSYAVL